MRKKKKRYVVKKRGRTISRIALLIGVLLLIVGLIWGVVSLLKSFTGKKTGLEELPFNASSNYTYTGSGFLYFGEGKLCYDDIADSRKDTSYRINTEDLQLAASSGVSALYHDSVVQIVGAGEPIVFSGRVLAVTCGAEHIAVLREDSAGSTGIVIYDKNGLQTDQIDFDATDLVDFGFSNTAGETLWTLEADFSSALPVSTITTYNLATKRTTGVMSVQSQLVSDVIFTDSSLFLSATSDLIRYNLAGSAEAYRIPVYGWHLSDYSLSGSGPMLLYRERSADTASLRIYTLPEGDVASAQAALVRPEKHGLAAFLINGRLKVYTSTEVYTYSAKGELVSAEALPVTIDGAVKLSDQHVLLQSGDRLFLSITK